MAPRRKYYGPAEEYEKKLDKVMKRFGVSDYRYDWNRESAYVEFCYCGQWYHFDNDFKKTKAAAEKTHKNITYVSDLFAQIVLALESLARLTEQGLYSLQYWIEGMKMLPAAASVPACFAALGFDHIPTEEELKQRFRARAKTAHPDAGGTAEEFEVLKKNYLACQSYLLDNGSESEKGAN